MRTTSMHVPKMISKRPLSIPSKKTSCSSACPQQPSKKTFKCTHSSNNPQESVQVSTTILTGPVKRYEVPTITPKGAQYQWSHHRYSKQTPKSTKSKTYQLSVQQGADQPWSWLLIKQGSDEAGSWSVRQQTDQGSTGLRSRCTGSQVLGCSSTACNKNSLPVMGALTCMLVLCEWCREHGISTTVRTQQNFCHLNQIQPRPLCPPQTSKINLSNKSCANTSKPEQIRKQNSYFQKLNLTETAVGTTDAANSMLQLKPLSKTLRLQNVSFQIQTPSL